MRDGKGWTTIDSEIGRSPSEAAHDLHLANRCSRKVHIYFDEEG